MVKLECKSEGFIPFDHHGNLIFQQNISSGLPNNLDETIINLINEIDEVSVGDVNQDGSINVLDVVAIVNFILNSLIIML